MIIRDDGVGFDPKKDQAGNGLKNIMSRAKKMRGSISLKSKVDMGTVAKIRFPF